MRELQEGVFVLACGFTYVSGQVATNCTVACNAYMFLTVHLYLHAYTITCLLLYTQYMHTQLNIHAFIA